MPDKAEKNEPMVKYTGHPGVRRITRAQWEAAGVTNQGTTEWNQGNGYAVPAGKLKKGAIEILAQSEGFKLV
jgi:hypothetical protein